MANTIASSPGVSTSPSGALATSANFRTAFDFSDQYLPDTFLEMFPRYGNGKLTSFAKLMGMEKPYESDLVKWTEQGRLNQIITGASVTTDTFDCGSDLHNLRVGDTIHVSNGTNQYQADVYEIVDANTFKAHNRSATGAFSLAGDVSIFVSGNEFAKKTSNFTESRTWEPEIYENYSHIIKEFYDVPKSDMAQLTWVQTPEGKDNWYVYDWERTRVLFENKIELTNVFGSNAVDSSNAYAAGKRGLKPVEQQVKSGGNVGNGNIDSLADIDEWTKRLRKQGNVRTYMIWADQLQHLDLQTALEQVNAPFAGGANYGLFDNDEEMALHLEFQEFSRAGFTFDLTRFDALDDPTYFGEDNFLSTGIGSIFVPAANKTVMENDQSTETPYLCLRNRKSANIDRTLETKIMGTPENPIREDSMEIHYTKEMTNQVVGVNEWVINNR